MPEQPSKSVGEKNSLSPEIDIAVLDWFELRDRFLIHLFEAPELHYHIGPDGDSQCLDSISLIWTTKQQSQMPTEIMLDVASDIKNSDGKTVDYGATDADITIVQIAKIVADHGEPNSIHFERIDSLWRISQADDVTDTDKTMRHKANFDYADLRVEILKAGRALSPDYADMSLAEIGHRLKMEALIHH